MRTHRGGATWSAHTRRTGEAPSRLRCPACRPAHPCAPAASTAAGAPARPFVVPAHMSLRPFLSHLEHHPDAPRLAEPDTRAFVSQSLRAYVIAAVADRDARRPAVVVAGDDRAARDLAADLRA